MSEKAIRRYSVLERLSMIGSSLRLGRWNNCSKRSELSRIGWARTLWSDRRGLLLPVEERKKVMEASVRNSPQNKQATVMLVLTGSEAVELTCDAARAGAHVTSSLAAVDLPFPLTKFAVATKRSRVLSDLPVRVLLSGVFTSRVVDRPDLFLFPAISNVVGLSSTDFYFYRLSLMCVPGTLFFSGRDEAFAARRAHGREWRESEASITLRPELFVQIRRQDRRDDYRGASADAGPHQID